MGHWKREAVKLLIKLYQQNVFLYDPKHKDYYNRKIRDKVMQDMCQEINKLDPGKALHDIKMKLKTVRSQYAAEKLHMLKAKQKSGPNIICEPALWCYEDLMFLDKYMNIKGESSQDPKKKERPEYTEWNHTDHLYESQIRGVGNETEKVASNGSTDPLCDDNNEDSEMQTFDTVSNTSENSQTHEIACDIFGNFVASEMKQILNKNIYTKTKWKIQNAIMEGVEEQMRNESV